MPALSSHFNLTWPDLYEMPPYERDEYLAALEDIAAAAQEH